MALRLRTRVRVVSIVPAISPDCRPLEEGAVRAVRSARTVKAFWSVLKRVLAREMPHHSISLYFNYFSPDGGFRVLHEQQAPGGAVPWSVRRKLSPAPAFLRRHPGIKMYRLSQLFPDAQARVRSEYFTQVMQVEDWRSLLGLGFWEQDQLTALLVLRRAPEQGEFSPDEAALLKRWHPHLHDALRHIQKVEMESAMHACLSSCLEALSLGVMIFNADLRLQFRNAAATRLCVEWVHGQHASRALHLEKAFAIPPAVRATLEAARRSPGAAPQVATGGSGPASIRVQVIKPNNLYLTRPFYLVQLEPNRRLGLPSERADETFAELTPSERKVALMAAEGLSNGEIAARLGKSARTVAVQMGAVLAKLRLTGRVQLARLAPRGNPDERLVPA